MHTTFNFFWGKEQIPNILSQIRCDCSTRVTSPVSMCFAAKFNNTVIMEEFPPINLRSGPSISACFFVFFCFIGWLNCHIMTDTRPHCFYPNGNKSDTAVPSFPDLDVSPCCPQDESYLANGLCVGKIPNVLYRATCTDPSWKSPNCPQYCLKSLSYIC